MQCKMQIMTDEGSFFAKLEQQSSFVARSSFFTFFCVHHAKVLFINQKPRRLLYLVKHVNRKIIKSSIRELSKMENRSVTISSSSVVQLLKVQLQFSELVLLLFRSVSFVFCNLIPFLNPYCNLWEVCIQYISSSRQTQAISSFPKCVRGKSCIFWQHFVMTGSLTKRSNEDETASIFNEE